MTAPSTGQLSYSQSLAVAIAGMLAQLDPGQHVRTARNDETGDIPFGVFLAQYLTTDDLGAKLPAAATDKLIGVGVYTPARNNDGLTTGSIKAGDYLPVLERGEVYVKVEQNVTPNDPVYARFATSANDGTLTQRGSVRKDADGVAAVVTITPTATNGAIYVLEVSVNGKNYTFEYIGDGSATAQEICDGLRARMAANAEFTALVTGGGSTTITLTGVTAGMAITATQAGDGVLAVVNTTPAAPTAVLVKGATFKTSASAGSLAVVQFNLSASRV